MGPYFKEFTKLLTGGKKKNKTNKTKNLNSYIYSKQKYKIKK